MNNTVRVAVLIKKDGKFLLGQEATKVIYGLWNCQQGKVEAGESLEIAAIREVKEETGLDVTLVKKLAVIEKPFLGTKEIHMYLGKIVSGKLANPSEEILDLQWFTKDQILQMKDALTGSWLVDVINTLEMS